jgi:hypothetical protein
MKILRQEDNYLKLELANGEVLIIDESDNEYNIKEEGDLLTSVVLYESSKDFYTPKASINISNGELELGIPQVLRHEGKIMAYRPSDISNMTDGEFWGSVRNDID